MMTWHHHSQHQSCPAHCYPDVILYTSIILYTACAVEHCSREMLWKDVLRPYSKESNLIC